MPSQKYDLRHSITSCFSFIPTNKSYSTLTAADLLVARDFIPFGTSATFIVLPFYGMIDMDALAKPCCLAKSWEAHKQKFPTWQSSFLCSIADISTFCLGFSPLVTIFGGIMNAYDQRSHTQNPPSKYTYKMRLNLWDVH